MKCRSGSKAFHWHGCSAGLSPLSACPQGRNSLESLSCQPPTSCPDQTHLQTLPLQPCALYRSSLLCCGIACGFQQVFVCKTHPSSPEVQGKSVPEGLGGIQITKAGSCRSSGRCSGAAPGRADAPLFSTCRGCGHSGDTCTRNTATWFSFKKQSRLLCSF